MVHLAFGVVGAKVVIHSILFLYTIYIYIYMGWVNIPVLGTFIWQPSLCNSALAKGNCIIVIYIGISNINGQLSMGTMM